VEVETVVGAARNSSTTASSRSLFTGMPSPKPDELHERLVGLGLETAAPQALRGLVVGRSRVASETACVVRHLAHNVLGQWALVASLGRLRCREGSLSGAPPATAKAPADTKV
jgi:hypothetical protein